METIYVLRIDSERLEFISRDGKLGVAQLSGDWSLLIQGARLYFRLEIGSFVTFGSSQSLADAFYVCVRGEEGTVVRLQQLVEARMKPGVICCLQYLYVFGGLDDMGLELKHSAERLPLSSGMEKLATSEWESLPPMTYARAAFLPCVYNNIIYLCGGFTPYCEQYDPVKQKYTDLTFTLREFDTRSHITVFVNQAIMVVSQGYVTLWRPQTRETTCYEIDKVPDPYCSGGVLIESAENSLCTLYYVTKSQMVSLTLRTSPWS